MWIKECFVRLEDVFLWNLDKTVLMKNLFIYLADIIRSSALAEFLLYNDKIRNDIFNGNFIIKQGTCGSR